MSVSGHYPSVEPDFIKTVAGGIPFLTSRSIYWERISLTKWKRYEAKMRIIEQFEKSGWRSLSQGLTCLSKLSRIVTCQRFYDDWDTIYPKSKTRSIAWF
jgi:hypothetical protein